jgi:hypothetical protein
MILGTVKEARVDGVGTLRILADGLEQEKDALLVNAALLPEGLRAGDAVLLARLDDGQRYAVVCKLGAAR